jgi:glycine/D-amino acid oxidase-like deaminating enzyme
MPEDVAAEYITFLGESQRKLLSGLRASRLDFDLNDSGGLHLAISDAEMDTLEKEAAFIRKHRDIECPVLDSKEVNNLLPSKSFKGGIFIPTEATFNPYKVINGMVRLIERDGARILTDTQVQEVTRKDDGFTVSIRHKGVIRAKQIVYCTNAYSSELLPELSSCMVPARGQMLATSRLPETVLSVLPPMSMMCNNGCEYFRVYDDRLLVGGMRHAVRGRQEGILYDGEVSQAVYDRLRKFVGDHLPFVPTSFTHTWSGIMCMTRDGLPLVGPIPNKPNEYIAAGFNGYGYSHALMSSMIIKDYLTKDKSTLPGARIFDPARLV